MACVGFWFAHEIVGFIIPDLEKKIVILSMNLTLRVAIAMRNRVRGSLATGAAPKSESTNCRYCRPPPGEDRQSDPRPAAPPARVPHV